MRGGRSSDSDIVIKNLMVTVLPHPTFVGSSLRREPLNQALHFVCQRGGTTDVCFFRTVETPVRINKRQEVLWVTFLSRKVTNKK